MLRYAPVLLLALAPLAQPAGELRFTLRGEPKTFNPLLVEDENSETIRYLTAGVLIRLNRYTQELEGELAAKWKVLENGRRIDFELRPNIHFSDGTPFDCQDVQFTMRQLMDPALHSPLGRLVPLYARRGGNQVPGAVFGGGALSRRDRRAGLSVRRRRHFVGALVSQRSGRAGAVPCWANTSRVRSYCCSAIQTIGRRSERSSTALSRFHPPRHPAESRAGAAALSPRRAGHGEQARSGHV